MTTAARVDALLADAIVRGLARLDAHLLMAHVLGQSRTWLLTHEDHLLAGERCSAFERWVARRLGGEPMAYLFGEKEFHGLMFEVGPAVLVPRPETELLVDWAIQCIEATPRDASRSFNAVDLGTGSGAVAVAVKHRCPGVTMTAVDLSAAALGVARNNATRHGVDIETLLGSWWQPLDGRHFDLALSNPPYIGEGDPHLHALAHEPALALTAGPDGLAALAAIIDGALVHLRPDGWLLVEHGFDQADAVRAMFAAAGFGSIQTRRDWQGHERCSGGRRSV